MSPAARHRLLPDPALRGSQSAPGAMTISGSALVAISRGSQPGKSERTGSGTLTLTWVGRRGVASDAHSAPGVRRAEQGLRCYRAPALPLAHARDTPWAWGSWGLIALELYLT